MIDAIETMLVATDFSEDAAAATEWAIAVARERQVRLVLVHAVRVAPPVAPEYLPIEEGFWSELHATAKEHLDGLAFAIRATGLAVDTELVVEPVVASILAAAAKHRADVIVAGTRGLTGWKRVVLGSVAARLVREARCPVVTTHAADPGRHRPVRTVLVPTDFSNDALLAAAAAARLLGDGAAHRLVLLHVARYPLVFAPAPQPALARALEDLVAGARRDMAALAERLGARGASIETRTAQGEPATQILEHAALLQADLIAMGTHGRSGVDRLILGSVAERVLSAAPCPVLTVRRA